MWSAERTTDGFLPEAATQQRPSRVLGDSGVAAQVGSRPPLYLTCGHERQTILAMRPRIVLGCVIVALLASASPAAGATQNETEQVALVRGWLRWVAVVYPDRTMFRDFMTFNMVPGTRLDLSCTPPSGRSCPIRAREVAPQSGHVNLRPYVLRRRLPPGAVLRLRFTDAAGRSKQLSYTTRNRRLPVADRSCFDAQQAEVSCAVECEVGAVVPAGDVCEGAGRAVNVTGRYRYFVRWGAGRRTWFTRLRFTRLPPGTTLQVTCWPPPFISGCPFGVMHVLVPRRGVVDVERELFPKHSPLRPGTTVSIAVSRANERASVLLFHMRARRKARVEKLCRYPYQVAPDPVRC